MLPRSGLAKGLPLRLTCSRDASAVVGLTVARKVATRLKLKLTGSKLRLATGRGSCRAAGGGSVRLTLGKAPRRAVQRSKGRLDATLTLRLTTIGSPSVTRSLPVKLG